MWPLWVPRCVRGATSSRRRPRPRRPAMPRAPPRWLCPGPGLLHPAGHRRIVTFDSPPRGLLARPAVPPQQPPRTTDRQRHPELVRDQHAHPRERPPLVRPPLSDRTFQQKRLKHGEGVVIHLRPLRRARRTQCLPSALAPGPAPPFHRPHTDPQPCGYRQILLTPRKAINSEHAHPLARGLAMRSETTTLRIPHAHQLPQGSSDVTPDNSTERSVTL